MIAQVNYLAGLAAEETIAKAYCANGGETLQKRYRAAGGEVDLVVRDARGVLVFVEVKKSKTIASASLRITPAQMRRVHNTALQYMSKTPAGLAQEARIDVALVGANGEYEIFENAYCA